MQEKPEFKSVHQIVKRLVFKDYRFITIAIGILCVVFSVIFIKISFVPFFVLPMVTIGIYVSILYRNADRIFMREFAKINNLSYSSTANITSVTGRLFNVGHAKVISNVLSDTYNGHLFRLFNYQYTVGSGKNSHTYMFTICEVAFPQTKFPYILLQSRKMSKFGLSEFFGRDRDVEIPIEEDFKKNFKLFTRLEYEIEALQIFSHDILRLLQEQAYRFSIEFSGNKMYVYDDKIIRNQKELEEIFIVTRKMIDSSGPLLNRLHDDYASLNEAFKA